MLQMEKQKLLQVLEETTTLFEQDAQSPAQYKELSPEYVERMAKAIVAFEIKVDALEHVFKLSQNRDRRSYEQIMERLNEQDADAKAVAAEMQKRKGRL